MINIGKKMFSILILIAIILIPLVGSTEESITMEERMPYSRFSLIESETPTIPQYPFANDNLLPEGSDPLLSFREWWQVKNEQREINIPNLDRIRKFTKESARLILSGNNELNMLYSPINTWIYLDLISNIAEGSSRAQVLDLLGIDDESDMGTDALFKALYWDDGFSVCRPSASIWINQLTQMSDSLLSNLAAKCHTSVFQGPMGEDEFNQAFQTWLNNQTNNLLKDVVKDLGFDRETAISLCTALYYRSSWSLPFNKDDTYPDVFYSNGKEITADFMRKEEGGGCVYLGTGFSSIIMDLQDGSYAALVLPDSEKSVEEVLQSDELFDFLFTGVEWSNVKKGRIKISMPKVDVFAAAHLEDIFARLGVTDIFDPEKAEFFDDIISDDNLVLTPIEQFSRLIMNEDGVEAASTIVSIPGSFLIPNEEEIDYILNRPFIFAVFSETNIPLIIGSYSLP